MERGNSKHAARLDDEMAQELRGLAPGGVDSTADGTLEPHRSGAPPGMTYDEVEQRSRLGRYIPMASLPGDRDGLIVGASDLDAPDDVLAELARLPVGEEYETVSQIWAALGHHNEERRT